MKHLHARVHGFGYNIPNVYIIFNIIKNHMFNILSCTRIIILLHLHHILYDRLSYNHNISH